LQFSKAVIYYFMKTPVLIATLAVISQTALSQIPPTSPPPPPPPSAGYTNKAGNRATGESLLYPLEDETKVDEWRKETGLEPLKDYLKRTNIKYVPSTQKK
jgi:hypothetical protein